MPNSKTEESSVSNLESAVAPNAKIRFSIGTKLVGLIGVVLLSSVVSLVFVSTKLFIEDNTALIQQTNADTAANLAMQMRDQFKNINEKIRLIGKILYNNGKTTGERALRHELFEEDKDFLGVFLDQLGSKNHSVLARALSEGLQSIKDSEGNQILKLISENKDHPFELVSRGEPQVSFVKLNETPLVVVSVPYIKLGSGFSHSLTAVFKQNKFSAIFGEMGVTTGFLVNRKGNLLAHRDPAIALQGGSVSYLEVVKRLLEGKADNGQTRYLDSRTNEYKLGAFRTVGFAGLGLVVEVLEAKAFEAAKKVEYRSMLIGLIVLCLAFFTGYLYSGTITWPIKQLMQASRKISAGDFQINLKPRGNDEIAHLSQAFNEMAKGLEERDKVKETFNKFHSKEIAEKLLSGEVKLGGERKDAVIFFSDVRGFTAMSESMSPEQVVELLNEYMTRMVAVIRSYGGIVDKYVGDAIMALWGVPFGKEDDLYHAVRACISMREELAKLNELRISRGQHTLKIGMGLNMGQVIAGNIGSNEKMEYTVIGDTVNLASRIESMTKEYGTDCLVSKPIFEKLQGRILFERCKAAKVKGKADAIEVFRVTGYIDENGKEITVETAYSSYQAEKSDKVVHDAA